MAISIENPVNPREGFYGDSPAASASKAALLLVLGVLYGQQRPTSLQDLLRFQEEFPLPKPNPGARLDIRKHIEQLRSRYDIDPVTIRSIFDPQDLDMAQRRRAIAGELVQKIYKQPDPETAADILLLAMGDPDEQARVAAAISALDMFENISLPVRALLFFRDDLHDEIAKQLAEVALHRLGSFSFMGPSASPPPPQRPSLGLKSALIVHGSHFGSVGDIIPTWWKPSGDFHTYIKNNFRPNLYSKPDYYTWSGGWSDHARQLAARDLLHWVQNRNFRDIDVLAHSHGGSVVMWATQLGVELDQLILMSCPVHWQSYQPEFTRIKNVISYQIKFDWVILADRGGTYFNHPRITDHVLPQWFWRHDDTHDPATWQKHNLMF